MKKNTFVLVLRSLALLPLTLAAASAAAQGVTVISDFGKTPTDGTLLESPLVFDKAGNLYGVTALGGLPDQRGRGTVFELTKKPDGVWARKVLHTFGRGVHGNTPVGALILDADGNLYGATEFGGLYNDNGTVFKLSPRGDGSWKETILHDFTGYPDGNYPLGDLIFDTAGNLYGTTLFGGAYGGGSHFGGTVFKLTPEEGGLIWRETVIHSFTDSEGPPVYGLTMDRASNLYGTTDYFIPQVNSGVVFELSPALDGSWNYTTLHTFPGEGNNPSGDGAGAESGVILDADGNLYGTTAFGGAHNYGAVFEVPAGQGPNGPDNILYSFHSEDSGGRYPYAGLVFDPSGNLYGTTGYGGPYDDGKLFELSPNGDGTWSVKDLHNFGSFAYNGFPAIDGINPDTSMIVGPDGNLYGATAYGGYHPGDPNSQGGTVFELKLH